MGIDISNKKEIFYNPEHDNLLGTSIPNKLTETREKGKRIYSIFRRVKNKDGNKKGDSNPAIYALKGLKGYKISNTEKKKFLPNFFRILKAILHEKNIDLIILIPSSYPIASHIGLRVSKILGGIDIKNDFFKKSKNLDFFDMSLSDVKDKDKHEVKRILKNIKTMDPNEDFSMKAISNKYRKYFKPLKEGDIYDISEFNNILIVDDLYASGTTIGNAIELVAQMNMNASIEGLCLFSHLEK